ncbi:MAG: hypothetical protein M0R80_08275 [Proteobacteria bacterium]|jgi:hypothetical protein|nr:hypothetical protein [Pseudomonadota bacterium]
MKILIITYYRDNHAELAALTNKNKIDYCNYRNTLGHSYTFFPWEGFYKGVVEYAGYYKIKLMKYLLKNTNYDVIFYQDTDTLIMNFTIAIESLFDEDHSFFPVLEQSNLINAGNFILKNNDDGRKFIDFLDGEMIHWAKPVKNKFQEQGMLRYYCTQDEWKSIVKIMPQRAFNSYIPQGVLDCRGVTKGDIFQKGDFLLHFATHTLWGHNILKKRIELVNYYQKDIIYSRKLFI